MKFTLSVCILLLTTLVFTSCKTKDVQPETQLLLNSDLEQDPSKQWFLAFRDNLISNPNKYRGEYTTEAAASGTHSLKISCDTIRNDTTHCYFYQSINPVSVAVGAKLTLKTKVKTVNLQGKGLTIVLFGYKVNSTGSKVTFSTYTPIPAKGTTDFTEYTVVQDKYLGDAYEIYMALFYEAKTTGKAYFDDIYLTAD
jgi:hypothetical protein